MKPALNTLPLFVLGALATGCQSPTPTAQKAPPPIVDAGLIVDAAPQLAADTDTQRVAIEAALDALNRDDTETALTQYLIGCAGPASGLGISACLGAAELEERAGHDAKAKAIHTRMLDEAPHIPEVQFAAGRFFGGQRDHTRAAVCFRRAITLQPDFLPAYPMLAGSLHLAGDASGAAKAALEYEMRLNTLLQRLRRGPPGAQLAILDVLATIDDDRAGPAVITALSASTPDVRIAAAGIIADAPNPAGVKALAEAALAETVPVARRVLAVNLKRALMRLKNMPPEDPEETPPVP